MQIIVCTGIVSSGKSTWAIEQIKKDPTIVRVNRDQLRIMTNNYIYSKDNEKLVVQARNQIIIDALKANYSIICDDCNIGAKNFDDICKLVRKNGLECEVVEKLFYIDLQTAIERNAKREGFAKIPEDVIRKMWNQSGKESFKNHVERKEIITNEIVEELIYNPNNISCALCDLDNSLSIFNSLNKDGSIEIRYKGAQVRSPYDASKADEDTLNKPLAIILELLSNTNKIIFLSGRLEKFRPQTEKFLNKNLSFKYELFMRKDDDKRSDDIVKKEIFDNNIRNKYNTLCIFDDRLKVCKMWDKIGLTLFRLGDPCSDF